MSGARTPSNPSDKKRALDGVNVVAMLAAITTISAVGVGLGLSSPLLSLLMELRGDSATVIGANTAMAGLAVIIMVPFVTPIARQFGVVNSLIFAILSAGITLFLFYIFENIILWFVFRFIFSASISLAFILSEFWINSIAPEKSRGLVLGIYATVLSIGFSVGPAILSTTGIEGSLPFLIGCGIIIVSIIPAIMARNHQPVMERNEKTPSVIPYLWVVPLATAGAFVFGAVEQGELALLPVYGTQNGYNVQLVSWMLVALTLGNVVFQIPLGILSDKMDRRLVLLGCAIIGVIGSALFPFLVSNYWAFLACLFLYGGVVGGMYTIGLAHLGSRLQGTDLAQANAAFILAYGIGMIVGPQAVGLLMDYTGTNGFAIGLLIFFLGFVLLYFFRSRTIPNVPRV